MPDIIRPANYTLLPKRLAALLPIAAEPGNFSFNPVKFVKIIRKRAPDMNNIAKPD